jgi:hypothetical protein
VDEVRIAARIPGYRPCRGGGRLAQLAIDLGNDHLRAFLDEPLRRRAADATSCASDDGDLSLKPWPWHRILRQLLAYSPEWSLMAKRGATVV